VSMGVRLFPAVHGHMADSVRDHGPGLGAHLGGIARDGEAEADGFTEPLVPGFRCPPSSGKGPSGSRKITRGSRVWPTGSTGSHENAADIGVSTWTDHAGVLPGLRRGCRMQQSATDKPASSWPAHLPLTDLGCTCGGPFMYLAGW
jgi:hypothetical protein